MGSFYDDYSIIMWKLAHCRRGLWVLVDVSPTFIIKGNVLSHFLNGSKVCMIRRHPVGREGVGECVPVGGVAGTSGMCPWISEGFYYGDYFQRYREGAGKASVGW